MKEAPVRLQKFLASQGIASRREADRMVEEGRVEIDGRIAQPGDKVIPEKDSIQLDGRVLRPQAVERRVIAINKPRGMLSSHKDPHHAETVMNILPPELRRDKWIMVGRLDKDSEGLLLLTNDGDFAQQLSHPSHGTIKRYRVEIDKPLDPQHLPKLLKGVQWEGQHLVADKVISLRHPRGSQRGMLEVHLHQGRKHEIRNLLYAFGYRVRRLKRFQVGQYVMRRVPVGGYRILSSKEIKALEAGG